MIYFLVGHRGVGKSALLRRIDGYHRRLKRPVRCFDLDEVIVSREQMSIHEIFTTQGESYFRRCERETLEHLLKDLNKSVDVYIALGAGFGAELPQPSHVIWVRRPTDRNGRIFLDRPLLNPELSPLADYLARVAERERRYAEICDEQLTLLEGFDAANAFEPVMLGLEPASIGGFVTVLPSNLRHGDSVRRFFAKRRSWGVKGFELRDDLISPDQVKVVREFLTRPELLYSLRQSPARIEPWVKEGPWDWDLALGVPVGDPPILSCHQRAEDFSSTLEDLPRQAGAHIKLAVEVHDWRELEAGHAWWLQDSLNRSFLPRSLDGRWSWYRQLFGPRMKLAFWREGEGSAPDQPLVADWIRTLKPWKTFAAVLGDPVVHSHTPAEQGGFFAQREMPVVAIRLTADELHSGALKVLTQLGLRAAAVTSPLKRDIFGLCRETSRAATDLHAVNTIGFDNGMWRGHNTDLDGLELLLKPYKTKRIVVWGGGGTREALRRVVPEAHFYSVREYAADPARASESTKPEVVVWAVGRSHFAENHWPPSEWAPFVVVDLNYSEDSPGREYAIRTQAQYVSGEVMFKSQAAAQRTHSLFAGQGAIESGPF